MTILGLMSGSSLDGLDMAICSFEGIPGNSAFKFEILSTNVSDIPQDIADKIKLSPKMDSRELLKFDAQFGHFLGLQSKLFISKSNLEVDYIASHGHTVFHYPEDSFTFQLGNGAAIAQEAKHDVICDFRSSDIAENGLGAPFAPIADYYLFPHADYCLNLGGISNLSFRDESGIKALDISPCNQLLNHIAGKEGLIYDDEGRLARSGTLDMDLLRELERLNDLKSIEPRALDNSWISDNFLPILDQYGANNDVLHTIVKFITSEIIKVVELRGQKSPESKMLISGGGAFNLFLKDNLQVELNKLGVELLTVEREIVEYKEALLMAFMGYLRILKKPNAYSSVTGATIDTIGGCLYTYK